MTTVHIVGPARYVDALSTKTANYTLTVSDDTILADATSGGFTLTLPTAVGVTGRQYKIKKIDATVNLVTLATTSSQTIDGQTTRLLTLPNDEMTLESDGANWRILNPNMNRSRSARIYARANWR